MKDSIVNKCYIAICDEDIDYGYPKDIARITDYYTTEIDVLIRIILDMTKEYIQIENLLDDDELTIYETYKKIIRKK